MDNLMMAILVFQSQTFLLVLKASNSLKKGQRLGKIAQEKCQSSLEQTRMGRVGLKAQGFLELAKTGRLLERALMAILTNDPKGLVDIAEEWLEQYPKALQEVKESQ